MCRREFGYCQWGEQGTRFLGFSSSFFLFFFFSLFILLFLVALGLRCCTQAFSSCGQRGLLFVADCRLLIAVASQT